MHCEVDYHSRRSPLARVAPFPPTVECKKSNHCFCTISWPERRLKSCSSTLAVSLFSQTLSELRPLKKVSRHNSYESKTYRTADESTSLSCCGTSRKLSKLVLPYQRVLLATLSEKGVSVSVQALDTQGKLQNISGIVSDQSQVEQTRQFVQVLMERAYPQNGQSPGYP